MEKSFHPNTRDFVLARLSSEEKLLSISNVRIFPSRRMICVYAEWTTVKNTPLPLMLLLFVNPKYESSPPPPFYVLLKALVCAYIEERHEPLIRGEGREEDGQTFNCKKSPACLKGRTTTTSTTSSKRGRERETNIKLQAPMKRKSNCRTYTCKWPPVPWLLTYIYVKAVDRNTRSSSSSSLGKENVRTWASLFIPFIPTLKA